MLRVKRFAAAIDMIAAGTSAPIAIAAYPTPANHEGNSFSNSCGIASWGLGGLPVTVTPAAIATKPSSASRPSTECGYMNRASADPNASDAYAQCSRPGGMIAFGDA